MRLTAITSAALLLGVASAAHAAVNLVQNGSFSNTTSGVSQSAVEGAGYSGVEFGAGQGYHYGNVVSDWQSNGPTAFNLYFFGDGTQNTEDADTFYSLPHGEAGQRPNSNYVSSPSVDPDGGAFVVLDGDPNFTGALTQTIAGLTAGDTYKLTFDWAGGELADRTGFHSSQLDVTFGGSETGGVVTGGVTQDTATYINTSAANAPGSFSGWQQVTMYFKADGASDLLSFLAVGTPNANLPPVAFLDGVSLTSTPLAA